MNFKRYNESDNSWTDSHYIMCTDTDTLSQLPTTIYPNDTSITVGIKGNTTQSGTPSPQNPVDVNGTGERTNNLFDYNTMSISETEMYLTADGAENASQIWNISDYIPCNGTSFVLSKVGGTSPAICFYDANKNYIFGQAYNSSSGYIKIDVVATVPSTANYIRFSYLVSGAADDLSTIMLNTGSTAKPYEPYGYKIPISSNSTTTPVYLGDVQTTRKIKKLVLTGEESEWSFYGGNAPFVLSGITMPSRVGTDILWVSNYYQSLSNNDSWASVNYCITSGIGENMLRFRDTRYSNINGFKSYLAAQYAAGTPVTIWYVLATEETGIVNEPLMKIGTYADSVSVTGIPTTAGGIEFDVDTTLKPSEVDLTYHGWHDISPLQRVNGEWV